MKSLGLYTKHYFIPNDIHPHLLTFHVIFNFKYSNILKLNFQIWCKVLHTNLCPYITENPCDKSQKLYGNGHVQ